MAFCEERICSLIREPANTWSNLAFLAVGAALVWKARADGRRDLLSVGATEILVGFGSFWFHASATRAGEIADVWAMSLFANLMATTNLRRLLGWSPELTWKAYVAASTASLGILLAIHNSGVPLFILTVVFAFLVEGRILRSRLHFRPPRGYYRPLIGLGVMFAVAYGIWWLDVLRISPFCDPKRHWFTGHAAWHILNSTCFAFLYFFYRSLRSLREGGVLGADLPATPR
jgi:hypothetical protein